MFRAAVVAAMLVACSKHEDPPQKQAPAAPRTVAPSVPDRDEVALVSPGSEPRALLRYHFTVGTKAQIDVSLDLAMRSADLPAAALGTLPSPHFRLALEITSVDPDGSAQLRSTIIGTGATDQPGARIKAAPLAATLEKMQGLAFVAKVSPTGAVTGSGLAPGTTPPPELAGQIDQLHDLLEQVATALPTEPIGKDGQWKVTKHVAQQGLAMTVTTTFKLVDVKPDAFSFTSTGEEHAKPISAASGAAHVAGLDGTAEATGTGGLHIPSISGDMKTTITSTVADGDKLNHVTLELHAHMAELPADFSAQGAQSAP